MPFCLLGGGGLLLPPPFIGSIPVSLTCSIGAQVKYPARAEHRLNILVCETIGMSKFSKFWRLFGLGEAEQAVKLQTRSPLRTQLPVMVISGSKILGGKKYFKAGTPRPREYFFRQYGGDARDIYLRLSRWAETVQATCTSVRSC